MEKEKRDHTVKKEKSAKNQSVLKERLAQNHAQKVKPVLSLLMSNLLNSHKLWLSLGANAETAEIRK